MPTRPLSRHDAHGHLMAPRPPLAITQTGYAPGKPSVGTDTLDPKQNGKGAPGPAILAMLRCICTSSDDPDDFILYLGYLQNNRWPGHDRARHLAVRWSNPPAGRWACACESAQSVGSGKPKGLSELDSLSRLRLPTDPDVRDYRIRLLEMRLRYARQTER
jgi:hypothetical protein